MEVESKIVVGISSTSAYTRKGSKTTRLLKPRIIEAIDRGTGCFTIGAVALVLDAFGVVFRGKRIKLSRVDDMLTTLRDDLNVAAYLIRMLNSYLKDTQLTFPTADVPRDTRTILPPSSLRGRIFDRALWLVDRVMLQVLAWIGEQGLTLSQRALCSITM
ncbi:hypothetical protein J6590_066191 [Homalodisca vitripennis]|nr:hypothetical protein J6590_066191 [Homalodisca vitripennis]